MLYELTDMQSQRTVFGASILRSYATIVCCSATDILLQAAGVIASNYKLFEAVSNIVATQMTGP